MPLERLLAAVLRLAMRKSLQSTVTLCVAIVSAAPELMFVLRFLFRHQVPCVEIVAGSVSMKPVQLSYERAAFASVADSAATAASTERQSVERIRNPPGFRWMGGRAAGRKPTIVCNRFRKGISS